MAKQPRTTSLPVLPDEVVYLLPDESAADYRHLWDTMFRELKPDGLYQRQLVSGLVNIEWDLARHRRLLVAGLRSEFRRQAGGVENDGTPGLVGLRFAERDAVTFGRELLAGSQSSLRTLREAGVTISEITAAAMSERSSTIAYHETRIADLERRRRQIYADLERLKSKLRTRPDIDDAVELD